MKKMNGEQARALAFKVQPVRVDGAIHVRAGGSVDTLARASMNVKQNGSFLMEARLE